MSGDRTEAVAYVAREVGIAQAAGGMTPQDKLERLREWQQQGAIVAMVGDGVNDAPVLAAAQVSLAMGSGTQLAHATADMILPVSYTHLDVYKRQGWNQGFRILCAGCA